jgi:hypothetical protein
MVAVMTARPLDCVVRMAVRPRPTTPNISESEDVHSIAAPSIDWPLARSTTDTSTGRISAIASVSRQPAPLAMLTVRMDVGASSFWQEANASPASSATSERDMPWRVGLVERLATDIW